MTKPTRHGVFISYSHSDKKWLKLLQKYLDSYVDDNQISYWVDSKIKPGAKWLDEIEAALATTKVAVLLVTQDFLRSQFIRTHEMPEIIDASRSSGLELFWIPVGVAAYQRTLLNGFQAVHDPKIPLVKLKPYEREEIIVNVCNQIYAVLNNNGASEPISRQPTNMKTRHDPVRCNRTRYLNRFLSFFNAGLKDRPGLPQVCLVFGKFDQSHDAFINRIHREVIKPFADRESTGALQSGVLYKNDVTWPNLPDIEIQKEDLQIELSKIYRDELPYDFPPAFPAKIFAGLEQLSKYRFVIVKHTIDLGGESGSDWAGHAQMLRWYLQSYWDEVAKTLENETDKPHWPQFQIFIKVKFHTPGLLDKFNDEDVKADLAEIAKQTNMSFPCLLLGELLTPTWSEVVRWYTDNNIYNTEQDRIDATHQMYNTHGEKISMFTIEKELAKWLN